MVVKTVFEYIVSGEKERDALASIKKHLLNLLTENDPDKTPGLGAAWVLTGASCWRNPHHMGWRIDKKIRVVRVFTGTFCFAKSYHKPRAAWYNISPCRPKALRERHFFVPTPQEIRRALARQGVIGGLPPEDFFALFGPFKKGRLGSVSHRACL
jgi:hypothetical protein